MLTSLSRVSSFNVNLLERMIVDIPAERMCVQPSGLPNHPTWLVGHLSYVRFALIKQMEIAPAEFPEAWLPLFGRNSTPTEEVEKYPGKAELWDAFARLQQMTISRVTALTPEQLAGPHGVESFKESLPTLGDLLLQMLTAHDGLHVGQLSDWRRAMGYPRLMG
jgi:hypothetical protein